MNKKDFGWIAKIWLDVRSGKEDINKFIHGSASQGLNILAYTIFFDFHALMNDEISTYLCQVILMMIVNFLT